MREDFSVILFSTVVENMKYLHSSEMVLWCKDENRKRSSKKKNQCETILSSIDILNIAFHTLAKFIRQEKEIKGMQTRKERDKLIFVTRHFLSWPLGSK